MIRKTHKFQTHFFRKRHTSSPYPLKKYLKRVKEQFGKKQNKKSHGFLVYIVEGCHHVVQREDDVIYAKQRDQDEDRFSQASAKPRKRER